MKQKFEASEAIKKKKKKRATIVEDYGTVLPEDEQQKLQKIESDSNSSDDSEDKKQKLDAVKNILDGKKKT